MATVYNCLDALVKCGLARQVTLERGAARFCPNMREHGHFYCDSCAQGHGLPPRRSAPWLPRRRTRRERAKARYRSSSPVRRPRG